MSGIQIKWQQRVWSGLFQVPWTFVLLIANLTPLTFYPPQTRGWLYETLLTSKVFALSGDRAPGRISFGLRIWDKINAHSLIIAAASVPVGVCLLLWWLLGLSQLWSLAEPTSLGRVSLAQLISAAIVGGVAIDVFLLTQLPQLVRPRVRICFLKRNPNQDDIEGFFEESTEEETLCSHKRACLHLRITNTGTGHLPKLDLSVELPDGFSLPGDVPPGTPLSEQARFKVWREGKRVHFLPREHPLDTAPGASALYHVLVVSPHVQQETSYKLRLRIASERTNGFTEKKLRLKVLPSE